MVFNLVIVVAARRRYTARIERTCLMLKVIRGKKFYPLD